MERVLLTGAAGFVGRELSKKLLEKGYEVHALDKPVDGEPLKDNKQFVTHYADLTDFSKVQSIVKKIKPDYVIHLGGISSVTFSYEHYMEASEVNYLGTINLAETCRKEVPNFKQFILSGTSEEYGMTLKNTNERLTETSDLNPNSPYAISKVACDLYIRYMNKAYNFPTTIIRPFNTYGRKDNSNFFIERVITQMLKGGRVELGEKSIVRDWLYIDDHVDAYVLALGNREAIGQVIQVCAGKGYTTEETAALIAKLTGFRGKIDWNSAPKRPLEAPIIIGNSSKAKRILGWEAKYSLEDGLKKTVEHWKRIVK